MEFVDKEINETLNKEIADADRDVLVQAMRDSFDIQDSPMVGPFWYDPEKEELYGVRAEFVVDRPFYKSPQFQTEVKTGKLLHETIWKKEFFKKKDPRFSGNYTQRPRGRVFEFKDKGFVVFTGSWINAYPEVKQLVLDEFQLPPEKTEFRIDKHWEIGHGWSQELL